MLDLDLKKKTVKVVRESSAKGFANRSTWNTKRHATARLQPVTNDHSQASVKYA